MQCPFQTVEIYVDKDLMSCTKSEAVKIYTQFANCIKSNCPYYTEDYWLKGKCGRCK